MREDWFEGAATVARGWSDGWMQRLNRRTSPTGALTGRPAGRVGLWIGGLFVVALVLLGTAIALFSGFDKTTGGQVGVVRNGGGSTTTGSAR